MGNLGGRGAQSCPNRLGYPPHHILTEWEGWLFGSKSLECQGITPIWVGVDQIRSYPELGLDRVMFKSGGTGIGSIGTLTNTYRFAPIRLGVL